MLMHNFGEVYAQNKQIRGVSLYTKRLIPVSISRQEGRPWDRTVEISSPFLLVRAAGAAALAVIGTRPASAVGLGPAPALGAGLGLRLRLTPPVPGPGLGLRLGSGSGPAPRPGSGSTGPRP